MTSQAYNTSNPLKATKEVIFSKDTYVLEIREMSYNVLINGKEDRVYSRLPKSLKEFFNL